MLLQWLFVLEPFGCRHSSNRWRLGGSLSIFSPHSGHSCSHEERFILQQLGPPLYKTNCNTISPSAPEPIYETTGQPSNQFPNFWVKFLKCLSVFCCIDSAQGFFPPFFFFLCSFTLKFCTFQGAFWVQDITQAILCSCPCGFYDNWIARAPRTGRKQAL